MPSNSTKGWGMDRFWAPEIHLVEEDNDYKYRLVYTAGNPSNQLCIGFAKSNSPLGPFTDVSDGPLLCNSNEDEVKKGVGLIDGHLKVEDSGSCTLYYKVDGNADSTGGTKDVIKSTKLDDGCNALLETDVSMHTYVLENDLDWEGSCVEAPWYLARGEYEYIFYSSQMFNTVDYNVGVTRRKIASGGAWEKMDSPVLKVKSEDANPGFSGPGHCSVIKSALKEEEYYMIYHAHEGYSTPTIDTRRVLMMDKIKWSDDGWPEVGIGDVPSEGEITSSV